MSKELDYLDKILNYQPLTLVERTIIECIKEKIHRLEAIDNANPSEALECLEKIIDNLDDYADFEIKQEANEYIDTIKQALLKIQEPKQYLKWEDLEFSYGTKTQKVRMVDTIYKIVYANYDNTKEVQLLSEDEKCYYIGFTGNYKDNVQLFNDLHLERVEE